MVSTTFEQSTLLKNVVDSIPAAGSRTSVKQNPGSQDSHSRMLETRLTVCRE